MCMRPDICYVVSPVVWLESRRLEAEGLAGMTRKFFAFCDQRIEEAEAMGDSEVASHWRQVCDFEMRHACSPLSPVEADGVRVWETEVSVPDDELIRLYIANPRNPEHVPGQAGITQTSMRTINQDWTDARL